MTKSELKLLIKECIKLTEVDWSRFSDVQKTELQPEEVAAKLNAELDRLKVPSPKRNSADASFPRISKGNIPIDDSGKANLVNFIKEITRKPSTIFDEGIKSIHTASDKILTINTGIPALKAVLFDEDAKKFYVISTCPGAGACIKNCYAMRGRYIMNDGKNIKLINRLQMLMNHPDEYERIAFDEADPFAEKASKENKTLQIRWNDAGDIFSQVYFNIIINVTNKLKQKGYAVESYAYTKVGKYVKLGTEQGMTMSFSTGATTREKELVDMTNTKLSETVPYELFKDLFQKTVNKHGRTTQFIAVDENGKSKFKDENSKMELKNRIVDYYKNKTAYKGINLTNLKYTDELPRNEGQPLEFNAIVLPQGDSDRPAQRRDVRIIFLLEH